MKLRIFPWAAALAVMFILLSGMIFSSAWGQSEHTKRLVEGAKKEGKLLWYTALNINDATMLTKRFEQLYPFIKTETLRLGGRKLVTKILMEANTRVFRADVIESVSIDGHILKKTGLLEKYISPEASAYPASVKDPDGTWTSFFINTHVLVHNTNLVKRDEVPRTYEELIDPKWKGKIVIRDDDFPTFGMMLRVMEKENGLNLLRPIHNRMPAMLSNDNAQKWLAVDDEIAHALILLKPYPPEKMEGYEVSPLVSNPRNDSPECVQPVEVKPPWLLDYRQRRSWAALYALLGNARNGPERRP